MSSQASVKNTGLHATVSDEQSKIVCASGERENFVCHDICVPSEFK